jgi:hypothetical protein
VDQRAIIDYVNAHFDGVRVIFGSGPVAVDDTFFIYDPQRNPSAETFESAKPLLQEAYNNAVRRLQRVAG